MIGSLQDEGKKKKKAHREKDQWEVQRRPITNKLKFNKLRNSIAVVVLS